ncbi:MAG: hypothetical protein HWE16_02630 [Gammaproteobacteria bacterium]|nr:hypothetical protein [Gammaproteobacteria bacterium]
MSDEDNHIVGEHRVDCTVKNWEIISFIVKESNQVFRIVRGTIVWDRSRPFEPGYWVCSTVLANECLDENIVYSQNTCYELQGKGEFHETHYPNLYGYLMQGLDFRQATWAYLQNDSA